MALRHTNLMTEVGHLEQLRSRVRCALLCTMVEAVDADEFDVGAGSGLAGYTRRKASAAEEQEFRRLINTAPRQQTAQVLKPPELI